MLRRVVKLRVLLAMAVAVAALSIEGCSSSFVHVRRFPKNPLLEPFLGHENEVASQRTMQVLRQYDLVDALDGDPRKLLDDLQTIIENEPSADKLFSFAELSYRAGHNVESSEQREALDFYGAGVAYAYLYLFDERFTSLRNPYDPQFRGACDLYNASLEGVLRILREQKSLAPGHTYAIETACQTFDCTVEIRGNNWKADEIASFEFVNDYDVEGLRNQYRGHGLGVPLIAVRKQGANSAVEKHYPPDLCFPVTAFLRLLPDEDGSVLKPGARHRAVLELYDSTTMADTEVGPRRVPLESDLTTPIAYTLRERRPFLLDTYAFLWPDSAQKISGLYMLQPYEPHKIPVVMVHGMWSSPITWTEVFNDLRSEPTIRDNYQIWFYFYPSGQPFWTTAAAMRADLAKMREEVDPEHRNPALDQMVLVGHSMGGLVSKMQTISSENDFWNIVSDQPFANLKASPEDQAKLASIFFFDANPSVRRVVTIATPHRGSRFANEATRYLAQRLIRLSDMFMREKVVMDNPDVFRDPSMLSVKTSVDSLSPESPFLATALSKSRPPWVKYHNIVGLVPDKGVLGWIAEGSDGVVEYESAHLEAADSEIVVTAPHNQVHTHPRSVLEVRRILLEHLAEMQAEPRTPGGSSFTFAAEPHAPPPLPAAPLLERR